MFNHVQSQYIEITSILFNTFALIMIRFQLIENLSQKEFLPEEFNLIHNTQR